MNTRSDETGTFERLLGGKEGGRYLLQLFVSGMSPRSTSAIKMVTALCDELLPGKYTLEIVDLYDDPQTARAHNVMASPTLVRQRPLPVRRLIGDLSERSTVLRTLGLG